MRVDPQDSAALDRRVRRVAAAAALLGFAGVAAGAFGSHALKGVLAPDRLAVFDTAVRYHQIHALALLGSAWVLKNWPGRTAAAAAWSLLAGTLLFSGSLYALVLLDQPRLGLVTPLGGVCLMAGWILLAWSVTKPNISPGPVR